MSMDKQRIFRRKIFAAALGVFSASGIALAADEIEPNHPISAANHLSITGDARVTKGGATVKGVIGNLTGPAVLDVDFFSFHGQEGDVVTIDIDGGWGGARNVDTILTVFGPGPTYRKLRENDDAPLDPGSTANYDSRITNFRLPASGTYTVGVTAYPNQLKDGGTYTSTVLDTNGDYSLVISGVTLSVLQVNIEIKPGSGDRAPVNPRSKGNIPVALLSSGEFNALEVNMKSLSFGATGDEKSLTRCGKDGEDVNSDGRLDLVCHFENQLTNFAPGDLEGIVKGTTGDGRAFEGRGLLRVVPAKREG
jgi:hypothetical protein